MNSVHRFLRAGWLAIVGLLLVAGQAFAEDKVYPEKPNPPRLVNDFAHLLSENEVAQLEQKLEDYANSSSTQITIVTMSNLGGHDISEYSVHVFNDWGLGQEKKNNGVLMLVALDDGYGKRKAWITVGNGLQGVLTDVKTSRIFREQMVPAFKEKDYFKGLSDASDAVIAVTRGEYTSEAGDTRGERRQERHARGSKRVPLIVVIIIVIVIVSILRSRGGGGGRGGRGGGGNNGLADLATGMIIGNLLSGGRRGGGSWGGGGDWGGGGSGGFGGFGGGSTDGGGAGGSW